MNEFRTIFKNLEKRCDKFEHYFPLYEKWFSKFKNKSPKILEIGVQYGGSAEMWYKYFGKGTKIYGVDIKPLCQERDYFKIIVGDQGSEIFWENEFIKKSINDFDIIIDDGSHNNPHQIVTLLKTYNLLKDGGIYWCEDTHTSYYYKVRVDDGGYKNEKSFIEHTKNLIDVINQNHTKYAIGVGEFQGPTIPKNFLSVYKMIQGIHFYDSVVVIEKGEPLHFKRIKKK